MRGHARVSALIRMDIVQLREHHLRRARAHPLILSTFSPAEAMPPSGINTNAKMGSFSSIFLSTNTKRHAVELFLRTSSLTMAMAVSGPSAG